MAGEWKKAPLSELTDPDTPITYGVVKPGPEDPDGVLFIRGGDIADGRVLTEQLRTITREVSEQYRRTQLRGGEIVVSLVGNPGQVAIVPNSLKGANIARQAGLVRLRSGVDTRFVKYFLSSPIGQEALGAHSLGSVQQVINLRDLKTIQVPIPPLPDQHAIAHILGTLDDKIELNRRMNETLEAMARALFKSWFVDFDPVRANLARRAGQDVQMSDERHGGRDSRPTDPGLPKPLADLFPDSFEDSELGEIPKGWEIKSIADLAEVTSGKRPNERFEERSDQASVPLWGGNGPMAYVTTPLYDKPILLTGRVGTLGSVFRIVTPCWPSDNTLVLIPREQHSFEFLFLQLGRIDFSAINRGSTQPLLTQTDLKTRTVVVPAESLLRNFHKMAHALFARYDESANESCTLAAIRDTLLPRLISGEVRIPGSWEHSANPAVTEQRSNVESAQ